MQNVKCGELNLIPLSSVADPGCLSLIPDPTTATKEEGKKIFSPKIFFSHEYHKIVNNFIF
jgi:hypothetical protein